MQAQALHLLIAIDGSPAAMAAARCWAGWDSPRSRLATTLLAVVDRHAPDAGAAGRTPASALATVSDWFAAAGLPADSLIVDHARPAAAILDTARRRPVDLIAMGTRGLSPWRGLLLGSVAADIARHSAVPVWLMGPQAAIPGALGRRLRVLLAVDGSAQAEQAAAWLGGMGERLGVADIELVCVQPAFSPIEGLLDAVAGEFRHWGQESGRAAVAGARAQLADLGRLASDTVLTGDAAATLLARAAESAADVIVLAPQGTNALAQAVLGSVTLSVLQQANCPVLVVPPRRPGGRPG